MERPIFQPIGTPAEELDTPALVVDLGVMEQNIALLHNAMSRLWRGHRPAGRFEFAHTSPVMAALKSRRYSWLRETIQVAWR